MIGINKGPVIGGLITDIIRVTVGVQPRPLGKGRIIAAVIQNTLNNINTALTGNNIDVMLGTSTGTVYQMLPGQESPLIYAHDLEDIYARVRTGVVEVDVTVIIYKLDPRPDKEYV